MIVHRFIISSSLHIVSYRIVVVSQSGKVQVQVCTKIPFWIRRKRWTVNNQPQPALANPLAHQLAATHFNYTPESLQFEHGNNRTIVFMRLWIKLGAFLRNHHSRLIFPLLPLLDGPWASCSRQRIAILTTSAYYSWTWQGWSELDFQLNWPLTTVAFSKTQRSAAAPQGCEKGISTTTIFTATRFIIRPLSWILVVCSKLQQRIKTFLMKHMKGARRGKHLPRWRLLKFFEYVGVDESVYGVLV